MHQSIVLFHPIPDIARALQSILIKGGYNTREERKQTKSQSIAEQSKTLGVFYHFLKSKDSLQFFF